MKTIVVRAERFNGPGGKVHREFMGEISLNHALAIHVQRHVKPYQPDQPIAYHNLTLVESAGQTWVILPVNLSELAKQLNWVVVTELAILNPELLQGLEHTKEELRIQPWGAQIQYPTTRDDQLDSVLRLLCLTKIGSHRWVQLRRAEWVSQSEIRFGTQCWTIEPAFRDYVVSILSLYNWQETTEGWLNPAELLFASATKLVFPHFVLDRDILTEEQDQNFTGHSEYAFVDGYWLNLNKVIGYNKLTKTLYVGNKEILNISEEAAIKTL